MPQQNGRIFRDPNATPHALGISLDDIGLCIGLGSRDLGTLCQGKEGYETDKVDNVNSNPLFCNSNRYHGIIEKWSKAKPVWFVGELSFLGPDNGDDQDLHNEWEKRRKGNGTGQRVTNFPREGGTNNPYIPTEPFKMVYGIEVPTGDKLYAKTSSSATDIVSNPDAYTDGSDDAKEVMESGGFLSGLMMDGEQVITTKVVTLGWRYEPPLASSEFIPFKALDFDGYNKKCVSPMPRMLDNVVFSVCRMNGSSPATQGGAVTNLKVIVDAVLPAKLPMGNVTYEDFCSAMATRPQGNPEIESADRNPNGMYLCCLLYHTKDDVDGGVSFDWAYWVSSTQTTADALGTGVNATQIVRMVFDKIPIAYLRPGDEMSIAENAFVNGSGLLDDGTEGYQRWKAKLFWCSIPIQQNVLPGQTSVLNGDHTGQELPHILLRGDDTIPSGNVVSFVSLRNATQYVRAASACVTGLEDVDGRKERVYGFHLVAFNYTMSAVTYSECYAALFRNSDKAFIGYLSSQYEGGAFALRSSIAYKPIDIILEGYISGIGGSDTNDPAVDFVFFAYNDNDDKFINIVITDVGGGNGARVYDNVDALYEDYDFSGA